jgi:hypothetical protein
MNRSSHCPHVPNAHDDLQRPAVASPFQELMQETMASEYRFGHRQHVHLTWLAVCRYGTAAAVGLVSDGIQATARYHGAPQKYNATVSRAWVELVGHHAAAVNAADFDTFADRHPALLDKRLLTRFYRPATLASPAARAGWVEPDLASFPWQHSGGEANAGTKR